MTRRTRRIKAALVSAATAGLLGAGALAAAPAHAAGATFSIRSGYFTPSWQGATAGSVVRWYNGSATAQHLVARTNSGSPWGLDVWLQPGQSFTRTFGRGTYRFQVPERSSLRGVSCYGACGTVTVS